MIKLELYNDQDVENPCEWDGWKIHSFNTRHINFIDPQELGIARDGSPTKIGLRRKLEVGTAFLLSYYEHGNCIWMLAHSEEWAKCPDKQFDGVSVAGVIAWMDDPKNLGPKTYAERQTDAKGFLESYNDWCNGNIIGYSIEKDDEIIGGCGGFFGSQADYMFSEIREELKDFADQEIEVVGDAAWLTSYHDYLPQELTCT